MPDTYVECLVSRKNPGYANLLKSVVTAFIVVSVFLTLSGVYIMIIVAVLLGILAAVFFPKLNVEYEYIFMGDELDVDIIYNKSKRKSAGKYLMSRAEKIAMKNSHEIKPLMDNPNAKYKVADYTTKRGDSGVYAMIYSDEKGKQLVLFEPNEKLLRALKSSFPRQVLLEC